MKQPVGRPDAKNLSLIAEIGLTQDGNGFVSGGRHSGNAVKKALSPKAVKSVPSGSFPFLVGVGSSFRLRAVLYQTQTLN
ncbi:MAG TPA: hypothetical protein VNL73_02725 [Verrucomicrobiae bacterium]|nr:hypothetical protein [Verrucomicrobiae bacterium]